MKQKKVWRYYCEHCGKGGCSAGHIRRHETRCCRNPLRACGQCDQESTDVLANATILCNDGSEALKSAVDGCPACQLAAHMLNNKGVDPEDVKWFDYTKAHDDWWSEKHAEQIAAMNRCEY